MAKVAVCVVDWDENEPISLNVMIREGGTIQGLTALAASVLQACLNRGCSLEEILEWANNHEWVNNGRGVMPVVIRGGMG